MDIYPKPDLGSEEEEEEEEEEDLRDIDDDEISSCLNDERQAELKAKAWNLMHCQDVKRKRELENLPPHARKKAKSDSSAVARKENERKAKSSLSSKINFEALKKFTDEEAGGEKNEDEHEETGEKLGLGDDGEGGEEYGGGDDYGNDYEEEEEDYGGHGYFENQDDDDDDYYNLF